MSMQIPVSGEINVSCPRCHKSEKISYDFSQSTELAKFSCSSCMKPYAMNSNGSLYIIPHGIKENIFYGLKILFVQILLLDIYVNLKLNIVSEWTQKVTTLSKYSLSLGLILAGLVLFCFNGSFIGEPSIGSFFIFLVWIYNVYNVLTWLFTKIENGDDGDIEETNVIDIPTSRALSEALAMRIILGFLWVMSTSITFMLNVTHYIYGAEISNPHLLHFFCPGDIGILMTIIGLHWVTSNYIPPGHRRIIEQNNYVHS